MSHPNIPIRWSWTVGCQSTHYRWLPNTEQMVKYARFCTNPIRLAKDWFSDDGLSKIKFDKCWRKNNVNISINNNLGKNCLKFSCKVCVQQTEVGAKVWLHADTVLEKRYTVHTQMGASFFSSFTYQWTLQQKLGRSLSLLSF